MVPNICGIAPLFQRALGINGQLIQSLVAGGNGRKAVGYADNGFIEILSLKPTARNMARLGNAAHPG